MADVQPSVIVTGAAGNLGERLLPLLDAYRVVGIDFHPPRDLTKFAAFYEIDLGNESSCASLIDIFRKHDANAVVHLAFVIDPLQTGVLDPDRMWRINVAGTSRVMEAIAVVNRTGGAIRQFVFPSSVSAYGPETPGLVNENHPLRAHTLPYAVHKMESDLVVQGRAAALGDCSTYILRPHIFAGSSMQNYLVGALRGTPTGRGKLAERMQRKNKRLPMLLPWGDEYPAKHFQFVHVDDVARLIAYILKHLPAKAATCILNVAGRGEALTIARCAEIGEAKILHLPSRLLCKMALKAMWALGISAVPPDALPYIVGSYTMDTTRLKDYLGKDYESVIQYSIEEALRDSFQPATSPAQPAAGNSMGQPA
ncbi:MAG TPA: NAD-dependent epimerase/dehydratase family protein [Terriglobales bacterium]|nr:NAD-dependent epimerase/dehydratase family protein [Terriglobales bacterium]